MKAIHKVKDFFASRKETKIISRTYNGMIDDSRELQENRKMVFNATFNNTG